MQAGAKLDADKPRRFVLVLNSGVRAGGDHSWAKNVLKTNLSPGLASLPENL